MGDKHELRAVITKEAYDVLRQRRKNQKDTGRYLSQLIINNAKLGNVDLTDDTVLDLYTRVEKLESTVEAIPKC